MRRRDFIANRDYAPEPRTKRRSLPSDREGKLGPEAQGDLGTAQGAGEGGTEDAGAADIQLSRPEDAGRVRQGQRLAAARVAQQQLETEPRRELVARR